MFKTDLISIILFFGYLWVIIDNTVIDWNMYTRETCISVLMDQEKKKIGRESMIVEIDESLFAKREQRWSGFARTVGVRGGGRIYRTTRNCFLVQVCLMFIPYIFELPGTGSKSSHAFSSNRMWGSHICSRLDFVQLLHIPSR